MRTVYLGSSAFGATVLERLGRSPHRPELAVTRPDRPRGRGRRLASPPVADAARALGIELFQPEDVNSHESSARIAAASPEVVLICAYGALIKEPLLSAHELLNVHPSLLPRWRGAAPVERAIDAGDERTGVSIMRPTAELDAGPVCLARAEPIRQDDDFGSLSARLERLGGDLLVEALDRRPPCSDQPTEGVTIADKIGPADRRLDPGRPSRELERRVRALSPHIGAYVELPDGDRLQVLRSRPAAGGHVPPPGQLGTAGGALLLGCADGALELLRVKPAGGREMDAAAYLRGHGDRTGVRPRRAQQSSR